MIYIIHCLKDKYFNVDVPEMCRGCFYFIFNNNYCLGMKVTVIEIHHIFAVFNCMLRNVSLILYF